MIFSYRNPILTPAPPQEPPRALKYVLCMHFYNVSYVPAVICMHIYDVFNVPAGICMHFYDTFYVPAGICMHFYDIFDVPAGILYSYLRYILCAGRQLLCIFTVYLR